MRKYIWILSFILISGFVFGYTLKNQDPNKDKLLLEIISYVLDRGHYDQKDFNDKFSENVFMNYLENLYGQHRFFLNSDIKSFETYRFKIDDELKKTEINFFTVTFTKLMQRMRQVEGFYKELLDQSFDFSIKRIILSKFFVSVSITEVLLSCLSSIGNKYLSERSDSSIFPT